MADTRTTILSTGSLAAAGSGSALSLSFTEQWLRVLSLAATLVVSLMLGYFAYRREKRADRKAVMDLEREERIARIESDQSEDERLFLAAWRLQWKSIPPAEWPKPKGPPDPTLFS